MSPKSEVGAWMKFYPADWLAGTRRMPAAAKGVYVDLLCESWRYGGLPDDPEQLARICCMGLGEFAPLWDKWVRSHWRVDEGSKLLVNAKLERVRSGQEHLREAGKKRQRRYRERNAQGDAPRNALQGGAEGGGTQDSGLRTQDSGSPSEKEARKPRRDGAKELAAGWATYMGDFGEPSPGLTRAAEAYRIRRVKMRAPIWDRDQWAKLLAEGGRDHAGMIAALNRAEQAGWKSVHYKPQQPARPLSGTAQSFANLDSLDRKLRERGVVE